MVSKVKWFGGVLQRETPDPKNIHQFIAAPSAPTHVQIFRSLALPVFEIIKLKVWNNVRDYLISMSMIKYYPCL